MEIEVFSPRDNNYNYESVDIIDELGRLKVVENWFRSNKFELVLPFKKDLFYLLNPETSLLIEDKFYYADKIFSDGKTIELMGSSLAEKGNRRIIDTNYNRQAQAKDITIDLIQRFVTGGRNPISYLFVQDSNISSPIVRYQNSYGEVMEEIYDLAETNGFGFIETPNNYTEPSSVIAFQNGRDVSNIIEFSEVNENLVSVSFEKSNFDERNVAYVLGEGEDAERRKVIVNDDITGLERKELYVDARDLQKDSDGAILSNSQYDEVLRERGRSKLNEYQKIFQLSGVIDTRSELFVLGKDYDLGDTVLINSSLFNTKYTAQITSIEKTWDEKGYFVDPVFGKTSPTVYDILKRS